MKNLKNIQKIVLDKNYIFYTNNKKKDYKKCRINYMIKYKILYLLI